MWIEFHTHNSKTQWNVSTIDTNSPEQMKKNVLVCDCKGQILVIENFFG